MSKVSFSCAMRLSSTLLACAAIPAVAFAQDDEFLGQIVVSSASGIATTVQDAPAAITVIGSEEIQAKGARDLRDLLRKVPGLNLSQGNGGQAGVSFRGLASSRTLMLVDGKRLNSKNTMARDYIGDFDSVPLDAIERIEVVRGPMSTLYGSDAMGGVINIITKPVESVWSGSLSTNLAFASDEYTSDSYDVSGFISGPLAENLSMSAWAKNSEQTTPEGEIRRNQDGSIILVEGAPALRTGAAGSEATTLGARLVWTPNDAQEWGLEAAQTVEDYLPADGTPSNTITKNSIALTNEADFGTGQLSTYLRHEDSERQALPATVAPSTYKTTALESRYNTMTALAGRDLELTIGGLLQREALSDQNTNRDKSLIAGEAETAALYAETRLHWSDALTLTAGGRYDHHDQFGGHFTPRLYANYDFGNGMVLKAGYARAFVAPDLRSLSPDYSMGSRGNGCKPYAGPCTIVGNPDLQPETSDNLEIGVNYQGNTISWEATAFYNDVTDMIGARRTGEKYPVTIQGKTVDGYVFERYNLDQGRTAGVELGFSWQVSDDLTWGGTATYLTKSAFRYEGHPTYFPMSTTPKLNLATSVDYNVSDRLSLSGNVTYVGKQAGFILEEDLPAADANSGLSPSVPAGQNSKAYLLVDVAASYDLTDAHSISFGINNLFDKQPSSEVSYREDGRLFKIGLVTRF